jgi:hypothetical protein
MPNKLTDDEIDQLLAQHAAPTSPPPTGPTGQPLAPGETAPSWWQRNISGEGMSDPNVPEARPWAPEGTGWKDKLAVATAPLYTSDPEEVANLYVKHYGAEKFKDPKYGNTLVKMPNGYVFDPNKPGFSLIDAKSLAGQAALGTAATLATGGGALVGGAVEGGLQLGKSLVGGAAGTGITPQKAALDTIFAAGGGFAGPTLGKAFNWAGQQLARGGRSALPSVFGAPADEALVSSMMGKHGLDWDSIPLAKRQEVLGNIGDKSAADVAKTLNDPDKARALYTLATGKEFGENLSLGKITGDPAQLAKEAQLSQQVPGSKLAQTQATSGQELAGILDKKLGPEQSLQQAGTATQQAMQQVPGAAREAETAAWADIGTNYGKKRLYSSSEGTLDDVVAKALQGKPPTRGTAPAASDIQARIDTLTANPRSGVKVNDVVALRNEIATRLASISQTSPKAATEIRYLEKMRDGVDTYLQNNSSAELTTAATTAIEASKKAARLAKPQAPIHDEVGTVVDNLMHDTTMDPTKAFRSVADSHKSDAIVQHLRDTLPGGENNEAFELLRGGLWRDQLLKGGESSVVSLTPKEIGTRLGNLLDHRMANKLFSPEALAEIRRMQIVAEAAARRGAAPDAGAAILAQLARLPGWAKMMGAKALGGVAGGAIGGLPGAAVGTALAGGGTLLRNQLARRAANAAMQPPSLVPPGVLPGALGVGVGGSAAQAAGPGAALGAVRTAPGFESFMPPGLLNSQPMAVQSRGLMGGP